MEKSKKIDIHEEDIHELKNILHKYGSIAEPYVDLWPLTIRDIIERWDNSKESLPDLSGSVDNMPALRRDMATNTMHKFSFYWVDGRREVREGTDIQDAFRRNYQNSAMAALDFIIEGDDDNYTWYAKERRWVKVIDPVEMKWTRVI